MRNLSVYLRDYTKESILAPLFKLLEVVFDLLVPVVVARMINFGVAGNDRVYITKCFFILLLMAAIGLLCSITAQYFAARQASALQQSCGRPCLTIYRACRSQSSTSSARIP